VAVAEAEEAMVGAVSVAVVLAAAEVFVVVEEVSVAVVLRT
jgi:hypothetical protein